MNTIVNMVVLVSIAKTIMDFIVFNMLPNGVSKVLRNKRNERVTRAAAFAQLGMRSAISVSQFRALDEGEKGYLDMADLTRVFGLIEGVISCPPPLMARDPSLSLHLNTIP